ncbi:MAG TPA: GIY-YIG nuclease family protein [Gallionellaceae bacterium]|nr:GIY-YIG nuclease family protein [Gallionellaceae bacterium]
MAVRSLAWVCYLLECADGTLYCGITNNLEKRVDAHNAGEGAKYTRGRAPVRLAYAEACEDKSAALKRERSIKRLPRADKLALCRAKPPRRAARQGAGLTKRREKR